VIVSLVNGSLKAAESIVRLHTELLRPRTMFVEFLQCILNWSCAVHNDKQHPFLLPQILIPNGVHLSNLAT